LEEPILSNFQEPLFLPGGNQIVYKGLDYAIKVLDINSRSIQDICQRCLLGGTNDFLVFPQEKKLLIQAERFGESYLWDLDTENHEMLPIYTRKPRLNPDGAGLVYIRFNGLKSQCNEDAIMLYEFNNRDARLIKILDCTEYFSYSAFAFSPEGTVLVWNSNPPDLSADIFVMDIYGGNYRRLTDNPA